MHMDFTSPAIDHVICSLLCIQYAHACCFIYTHFLWYNLHLKYVITELFKILPNFFFSPQISYFSKNELAALFRTLADTR